MGGEGPLVGVRQRSGEEELDTMIALQGSSDMKTKSFLWTRKGIPKRLHLGNSSRLGDIVLLAKEGFAFHHNFWPWVEESLQAVEEDHGQELGHCYGYAGYDNTLDSMASVLIMGGPGVRQQSELSKKKTVETVDLFHLLLHLLKVKIGEEEKGELGEGSLDNLTDSLSSPPSKTLKAIRKTFEYVTASKRLPITSEL